MKWRNREGASHGPKPLQNSAHNSDNGKTAVVESIEGDTAS
jgi:hypothetical protein